MSIERLDPEEFEAGENITEQVRRSGSTGIVVSVRLTREDSAKLVDFAEENGLTVSQVARQAIRVFLSHRGQQPVFAPEITGARPHVNIVAFTPLGPRTVKEGTPVVPDVEGGKPVPLTGCVGS